MSGEINTQQRKPRLVIIALALLFITPLLIAVIMLAMPDMRGLTGTTNYGELIEPPRPLTGLSLLDETGSDIGIRALEGRWTYLMFIKSVCNNQCADNLIKTRQIWLALGKDANRAQRWLVYNKPASFDAGQSLKTEYPNLYVVYADNVQQLRKLFIQSGENAEALYAYMYLIDPIGNLMMRYTNDADASKMLKDMKRLLKVSWIRPSQ